MVGRVESGSSFYLPLANETTDDKKIDCQSLDCTMPPSRKAALLQMVRVIEELQVTFAKYYSGRSTELSQMNSEILAHITEKSKALEDLLEESANNRYQREQWRNVARGMELISQVAHIATSAATGGAASAATAALSSILISSGALDTLAKKAISPLFEQFGLSKESADCFANLAVVLAAVAISGKIHETADGWNGYVGAITGLQASSSVAMSSSVIMLFPFGSEEQKKMAADILSLLESIGAALLGLSLSLTQLDETPLIFEADFQQMLRDGGQLGKLIGSTGSAVSRLFQAEALFDMSSMLSKEGELRASLVRLKANSTRLDHEMEKNQKQFTAMQELFKSLTERNSMITMPDRALANAMR